MERSDARNRDFAIASLPQISHGINPAKYDFPKTDYWVDAEEQ